MFPKMGSGLSNADDQKGVDLIDTLLVVGEPGRSALLPSE